MDIRLLLATEPSSTHEDRIARSRAIRSFSTDTTHSADSTSSLQSAAAQLRRDAARVLQGFFDSQSRRSTSRGASPTACAPAPVRSATPTMSDHTTPIAPLHPFPRKSKAQRSTSKLALAPTTCSAQSSVASMGSEEVASSSTALSIGSSFSYTPLPDDYYSREAEYDYAAAHDYLNSLDSESEAEEPDTPPLDYMGTGTPLFTPRLMAKVLQAKAAGRPLQVSHSNARVRKIKDKKPKKKDGSKKDGKGKDKAKKNFSSDGRNRSVSMVSSGASGGHRKSQGGERASVGSKRSREDESDDELYRTKTGPYSDASSTPTAHEPPVKRPKGWKGWALVEVSSSEDEKVGANANLYDEDGRRIKSQSTEPQSQNVEEESELDSEAERMRSKPGWKGALIARLIAASPFASVFVPQQTDFPLIISLDSVGWALVKDPPDRTKLIKLDAPPLVLTTRATRSGRTFGDTNFAGEGGDTSGPAPDGKRRESTAGSISRKSSRASMGGKA
ncbi:hypothetical protein M407DRAFT_26507 [Tulasnella calospora MUT 4182]|uniref:Uncharacterized protein n=1 Tax=Tulasnella calospora MUT 4182 TaxID=1051891 RepID=A0A0C3QE50_9AGAM|nr:hypothetical protein M407DRAFT_26507 [Tulasnella calospora MUT 4182]